MCFNLLLIIIIHVVTFSDYALTSYFTIKVMTIISVFAQYIDDDDNDSVSNSLLALHLD